MILIPKPSRPVALFPPIRFMFSLTCLVVVRGTLNYVESSIRVLKKSKSVAFMSACKSSSAEAAEFAESCILVKL